MLLGGGAVKNSLPRRALRFLRTLRRLEQRERQAFLRGTLLRWLGMGFDRLPRQGVRPRTILFVCHGNILRSPMAAAFYQRELGPNEEGRQTVLSAGLLSIAGRPADPRGRRAAQSYGLSLDNHLSRQVTSGMVADADLILVMDRENEARLVSRFPNSARKLVLLGIFAPEDGDPAIPDPYSGSMESVVACYARIEHAIRGLSAALLESPPAPSPHVGGTGHCARFSLTRRWRP